MSGAAHPTPPAPEPAPSFAPASADLMPGRSFPSGVSDEADPGRWQEDDPAAHPAEGPLPALAGEQVHARLKVATWQLHAQEAAPHPNGAPPSGPPLALLNGALAAPDGGGLSNGSGAHDTSPPATLAASSPQHHAPDLRLSDHTRRLASVRTVGVRAARPPEAVAAALAECERALAAAHVREAELQRETRVLAARLAHLRMAHEAQASKLAEAAGRAVAARREVVAENAALAAALAAAQHSAAVYAQQLLPLLAPHGLTPPPSDPSAVAAAVATLVDRLATEINLLQKVVVGGGPVLEQRLQAAVLDAASAPAPPAASAPATPPPLQDVRGSTDSSLSLATGIGPAPPVSQAPSAGAPLFPGGTWSPLAPGAAQPSQGPAPPSSPPTAAPRSSSVSAAPPGRLSLEGDPPGPWPREASGVPERPTSVRFRPAQDAAGAGASLVRRSASWRGHDSGAAVRFRDGPAPLRDRSPDGLGSAGPGRGGGGGGGGSGGAHLRDSQRNLLDSVVSPQRGLAASPDPSAWQMSSQAEQQDGAEITAEGGRDEGDARPQQQQQGQQDDGEQDDDPLPAIHNLKIAGEAVLGGKLTACGHSVYGSSLCYFQWVRHKQDGAAYLIEGAKQPEYLVSADDARCQITVECLPVDDRGRKGEVVNAAANNGEPIPIDEVTSNLLTGYGASGKARFTVLDAHNGVEHELCIDRRSLAIKRGSHGVIKEPYSGEVQAEIAVNEPTVLLIHISGGRRMDLDCIDNRARDLAVLTLRHFVDAHLQYQDEKTRRRGFFSRR